MKFWKYNGGRFNTEALWGREGFKIVPSSGRGRGELNLSITSPSGEHSM